MINDHLLQVVMDSSAEVTISDRVYHALCPIPPVIKTITLITAGRNMEMKGKVVGPVHLTIGHNKFEEFVYVAPIDDDVTGCGSPPEKTMPV